MTELGRAVHRCRVAVSARVVAVSRPSSGDRAPSGFRCVLDDGTGQVDLLFLGRDHIPGLVVGAHCQVEGTARMERGRLTVWNPLYELKPTDPDPRG